MTRPGGNWPTQREWGSITTGPLDELIHGAEAGLDGICVNEHHQNAYGFMPGPNLMGSVLARATNGMDVGIVQMGATLPTTIPPIRVAEEYAMLDCISGGRVIAGMPLGSSMDVNLCYGIPPIEQRDRYYEAHDLIMKAWTTDEIFPWNGRYYQLPMVNLWPRPIQAPHPPVWVPGSGSRSTWDFATRNNHCYCYLSYLAAESASGSWTGFGSSWTPVAWTITPTVRDSCSLWLCLSLTPRRRRTITTTSDTSTTRPSTSLLSS